MESDNNNPVVQTTATVISHRKVGPHNPFAGTTEFAVLDAVLSFNGVWPCGHIPVQEYRYETHRVIKVELYRRDYELLTSPDAVLGWSEYEVTFGEVLRTQFSPSVEEALDK